jgi:hypothetical protein
MAFNVLISNVDDYLRNHGFLWSGRNGWRLSPVYDLNPTPQDVRRPRYELIDLGLPYYSVTAGINNKGQIVGSNQAAPNDPQYTFLWKISSSGCRDRT